MILHIFCKSILSLIFPLCPVKVHVRVSKCESLGLLPFPRPWISLGLPRKREWCKNIISVFRLQHNNYIRENDNVVTYINVITMNDK